jgi:superfamily II DNA or RNA helicase
LSITLRPYQLQALTDIRAAFRGGAHAPLYVLPTGGGKTVVFAEIARGAAAKHNRVLIIVHRQEILAQTLAKLHALGVTSGQIAAGRPMTLDTVQTAMVQTLVRRLQYVRRPDLIVQDEAHHVTADNSWGRVLRYWREVPRLGTTATPCRLDNVGLGHSFDRLIIGPQQTELIAGGFLSMPVIYRPPEEIIGSYHVKRGDFDVEEQAQMMSRRKIVGDVIAHYQRHMEGLPAICFCVSVEHSRLMAEEFSGRGYRARAVYGNMPDAERESALRGLSTGQVQVITSCDLISEGFDTPAVAGCILLRRTMSLGLYLQQAGRALRPFPGKTRAVILDHVGNYYLHGHVLAQREWSLDSGRRDPRREKPPSTTTCPRCYAILPGEPRTCAYCGHMFAEAPRRQGKSIGAIRGELVEAGVDPGDAESLAAFLGRTQYMSAQGRQRAMWGKAWELARLGDEGRRKLDRLREAVGFKRGWTAFVWREVMKRRSA